MPRRNENGRPTLSELDAHGHQRSRVLELADEEVCRTIRLRALNVEEPKKRPPGGGVPSEWASIYGPRAFSIKNWQSIYSFKEEKFFGWLSNNPTHRQTLEVRKGFANISDIDAGDDAQRWRQHFDRRAGVRPVAFDLLLNIPKLGCRETQHREASCYAVLWSTRHKRPDAFGAISPPDRWKVNTCIAGTRAWLGALQMRVAYKAPLADRAAPAVGVSLLRRPLIIMAPYRKVGE